MKIRWVILVITILAAVSSIDSIKSSEVKSHSFVSMNTRAASKYVLLVEGSRALKLNVKRRLGKVLNQIAWKQKKTSLSDETIYQVIEIRSCNKWNFSDKKIAESTDEQSWEKNSHIITIRDLKEGCSGYILENGVLYLLMVHNACFRIRLAVFEKDTMRAEYRYGLCFNYPRGSFELIPNYQIEEGTLGGPLD